MEASWCLESGAGEREWLDGCRTSSLRRRWDDFEALTKPCSAPAAGAGCAREALASLGLPADADCGQLASAFRRRALACHPDKEGCADAFTSLVSSYKAAQRALSPPARSPRASEAGA
mmetsp:Transcript_8158/g.23962  ORF Transcript_8158/g.23962 Transcript_8158/m.23962 type:complete len:118 (+) Transcript_8158:165-518(+)